MSYFNLIRNAEMLCFFGCILSGVLQERNRVMHIDWIITFILLFITMWTFQSGLVLMDSTVSINPSLESNFFLSKPGWIGFFLALWLATKKSVDLAKHSLTMTGSALSAYSSARHARRHQQVNKVSDWEVTANRSPRVYKNLTRAL